MMRKSTVLLLILFLIGLFLMLLFAVRVHDEKKRTQLIETNRNAQIIINELRGSQFRNWMLDDRRIPETTITEQTHGTRSTLHQLLQGRKLVVYMDYKMCTPCVQRNLVLLNALAKQLPGRRVMLLVSAPGGKLDFGIDFSNVEAEIWTTDRSLKFEALEPETPCYLLTENDTIRHSYHSVKHTDILYDVFCSVVLEFLTTQ